MTADLRVLATSLVEVQSQVGLALVVAFVPEINGQQVADSPVAFLQGRGHLVEVVDFRESDIKVVSRLGEQVADFGSGRDILVRRAAAAKALDEIRPSRLHTGEESFSGGEFLSDANVHQLPSDVGTTRAGAPGKDRLMIGFGFDFLQKGESAFAGTAELVPKYFDLGHG
jgi:hypothetical protein